MQHVPCFFLIYLGTKILKKDPDLTELRGKPLGGALQGHRDPPEPAVRLHAVKVFCHILSFNVSFQVYYASI